MSNEITSNKNFYKMFFMLAIPVMLQIMFHMLLNITDNLMVGQLGRDYIASLAFANKVYFIFFTLIFGSLSGSSIVLSRYYGKEDMHTFRQIVFLCFIVGLFISFCFMILLILFSNQLMAFFSQDTNIINIGSIYLYIVAFSLPFNAVSVVIFLSLRAMGKTVIVLYVAIIISLVNFTLNYLFIYGTFGFPRLELQGVAISTLFSRIVEMFIYIYLFCSTKYNLRSNISSYLWLSKKKLKSLIKFSYPILFADIIWVLSVTAISIIYAKLGTISGVTLQVLDLLGTICFIVFYGIIVSSNIVIAQLIGCGKFNEVVSVTKKILKISFILSFILSFTIFISKDIILSFYSLTVEDSIVINKAIMFYSIVLFFRYINFVSILGILRGGGDSFVAFFIDIIPLLFIHLPLVYYCVVVLQLPIYLVVFVAVIDEILQLIFSLYRIRSRAWIKK